MEVNKEEALRCLHIAQKHRNGSNLPSALKFARKSVSLYSTPEGVAMVTVIEREIESGGSSSTAASTSPPTPNGGGNGSTAKATGVEEHITSARARPGHADKQPEPSKKREYTAKQMEVVKRVKACKHHEYYEILAVERKCTENDVKKAYKKLALALHPDKNGAPGADEAFKMVSKAFQVLSDDNLRAAFDANPHSDPTQRGGGMPSRSPGFAHPGFSSAGGFGGQDIDPAELFNMFFGGGGMNNGFGGANVFTFGGPAGFQARYAGPRRRGPQTPDEGASPAMALLPMIILFAFALITLLPSLFSGTADPDPKWSFERSDELSMQRNTWQRGIPYWVNQPEWESSAIWQHVPENRRGEGAASYSSKVRQFERGVENVYIRRLQNECEYYNARKQQQINDAAGFFGIGADYDKINQLRAEKSPSCEQLRSWGLSQASNHY
ncbi:endoplasmic reticulum protein [Papiliotrema laurentii]|uniref:Endoplasmic reticulum protein n=1 Tax=Papiliotrema laurentii TaxID=5418 RepID=A0AAD9CVT1_PAPLA|nr:endoplasmic reticulum protein [Papiliotrema laurentii]